MHVVFSSSLAPPFGAPDSNRLRILVGTLVAAVLAMLASGYEARQQMVAATAWVTHISAVKVAIAECEIRLARSDWTGFREAATRLDALTEDPAQSGSKPRRFAERPPRRAAREPSKPPSRRCRATRIAAWSRASTR